MYIVEEKKDIRKIDIKKKKEKNISERLISKTKRKKKYQKH
jgi:hypothetical protein